jgi:hypothetical protein
VTTKNDVIGAAQLLATRHITPQSFEQTLEDYVQQCAEEKGDPWRLAIVFALVYALVYGLTVASYACR